ncbi:MAG: DUF1573 domain-containing protein, partial [Phycisphaerae bacterium]|nr:DUF1573 domain-containing protein [Phycisphaerae bacterium]
MPRRIPMCDVSSLQPTPRSSARAPTRMWTPVRGASTVLALLLSLTLASRTVTAQGQAPSPAQAQAQAQEQALAAEVARCPIKAQPAFKNFGFVSPNTTVQVDATLVNPLDRPVTCIRSVPTCQCTTLEMQGKVIPARGSITVPVSMKTSGATGPKTAAVRLMFDGVPGLVEIKLEAEVAYSIHGYQTNTYPGRGVQQDFFVNAFDFPQQTKGEVTIASADKKPFKVVSMQGSPPVFVDFNPATDPARESYRVQYDFSKAACADAPKYLVIETDRPDALLIDMRVRHACTRIDPAFIFAQYRENLGLMPVGVARDFSVEIKHANGVRIDSVQSLDPRLAVQLVGSVSDGDSLLVNLRAATQPGAQGVITSSIRFTGVGPDPKRPVPPGQTAVVQPRMADYLLYY